MQKDEQKVEALPKAFTDAQEQRLRELIREELQKIHEEAFEQSLANS
ncbi:hypothetical protein [Pseudomonas fluorescens]|nr:hypothetical protein [Pseudomonas fluorescens]UTL89487.1 hypothetical protein NLL86_18730 [Pseudomonas fluorescens]